jgi:hypothetical protein
LTTGHVTASRLLLALCLGGVIALTAVSAVGVRGSDQFWYVADVESIARGDGATTNTVFPATLLQAAAEPPYSSTHNLPLLYLVAPLAGLIGGYGAWLLLNVASVLAISLLIRSLLVPRVEEPLANLSAALFAVMPATFWQACQPLADASIALLVMLSVWSLLRPEPAPTRWPVAYLAMLAAALCREVFALPLLLTAWLYWRWSGRERRARLAAAAGMVLLAGAALWAKGSLLPQQLELSLAETVWRLLASEADEMRLYFDLGQPAPPMAELLSATGSRLAQAFAEHFMPSWRQSVFYLPFNLLVAIAASGWLASRREAAEGRLLLVTTGLLAVHLVTLTLLHASFRYGFVITAPLLVAAVWRLRRWLRPASGLALALWGAALVAGLSVDLALADKSRRDGRAVQELTAASRQALEGVVAAGETLAFEAADVAPGIWYLWASHAWPDSTVLYLEPTGLYDPATYDRLRQRSGAVWLICRGGSPLTAALRADPDPVAHLPGPASDWAVHRLPRPVAAPAGHGPS